MRWMLAALAVTGCWRGPPPLASARGEPSHAFGCFTWRGTDRHGTVCTARADCEALRDDKLLRDDSWSYGRCAGAASIACFIEEPDYDPLPTIEHCFADADECERYRARARSHETQCRVLQTPARSILIGP
jgi:hypothetical protein